MEFSRQLHPLLASMPQLRKITDLTQPASWWVHTHTLTPSHPHSLTTLTHSQLHCLTTHTHIRTHAQTKLHTLTALTALTPSHPHTLTRFPAARGMHRLITFHAGPTNSGKTHAAMEHFLQAHHAIYCAPLRMLAHEMYQRSNDEVSLDVTKTITVAFLCQQSHLVIVSSVKQQLWVAFCGNEMLTLLSPH